jgi:hypothetical protein
VVAPDANASSAFIKPQVSSTGRSRYSVIVSPSELGSDQIADIHGACMVSLAGGIRQDDAGEQQEMLGQLQAPPVWC